LNVTLASRDYALRFSDRGGECELVFAVEGVAVA
jgi:hypothetical protein